MLNIKRSEVKPIYSNDIRHQYYFLRLKRLSHVSYVTIYLCKHSITPSCIGRYAATVDTELFAPGQ